MNKLKINFNILILILVLFQVFLFSINKNEDSKVFTYLPNSIEKFTTMVSGKNGVDIITADKMIKINDEKTVLIGDTSLKNDEYEISSKNVTVNSNSKITSSLNDTITKNNQGTVTSKGFEFDENSNTMIFKGESEFHSNDN